MKNMKSYTDLEQSKKLAEILPIDSADMSYRYIKRSQSGADYYTIATLPYQYASYVGIPCWSLAALLQIMPHYIDDRYNFELGKPPGNSDWYIIYVDTNHFIKNAVVHSNLIDACVEMILKLHEQKLL